MDMSWSTFPHLARYVPSVSRQRWARDTDLYDRVTMTSSAYGIRCEVLCYIQACSHIEHLLFVSVSVCVQVTLCMYLFVCMCICVWICVCVRV